ncbi:MULTISPECIES: DUF5979 domain-containing protein [unclassified Microbacterium]|uniref:DUF5979 domain-containing protein n=1 Tax=unclassified Microbacterium TaxID=2609290 RepID=UPI001C612C88
MLASSSVRTRFGRIARGPRRGTPLGCWATGGTTGSGTLNVVGGAFVQSPVLPLGATVHLEEVTPTPIPGTNWATPTLSRNDFQVTAGGTINVILTNTLARETGVVTWEKTDAVGGAALAGSVWELVGPAGTVSVTDNAAGDADPAVGAFQVVGLGWGGITPSRR